MDEDCIEYAFDIVQRVLRREQERRYPAGVCVARLFARSEKLDFTSHFFSVLYVVC